MDRQNTANTLNEKEIQENVLHIILDKSLLTILLKSAHDLSDVDAFSKSDAFAEIQFQGPKMRTEFVPNNLSPKWN
jgi:Ca2+-dependent lipid-binding protein